MRNFRIKSPKSVPLLVKFLFLTGAVALIATFIFYINSGQKKTARAVKMTFEHEEEEVPTEGTKMSTKPSYKATKNKMTFEAEETDNYEIPLEAETERHSPPPQPSSKPATTGSSQPELDTELMHMDVSGHSYHSTSSSKSKQSGIQAKISEEFENSDTILKLIQMRKMTELEQILEACPEFVKDSPVLEGKFMIHLAVEGDFLDLIKLLVEQHGVEVNCETVAFTKWQSLNPNICDATNKGDLKRVQVESTGMRPIHFAISLPHSLEIFDYLLEKGAEIDSPDAAGWSPLMHAVILENYQIVKSLLERGANPNILIIEEQSQSFSIPESSNLNSSSKSDSTDLVAVNVKIILNEAIQLDHYDIVQELLAHGANVAAVDSDMRNALHTAVYFNRKNIVKLLLQHENVVVDAPCIPCIVQGISTESPHLHSTALHLAAYKSVDKEIIRALLKAGANAYVENAAGETPVTISPKFQGSNRVEDVVLKHK